MMNLGPSRLWTAFSRVFISVHPLRSTASRQFQVNRTMSTPKNDFEEDLTKNPYYEKYAKKIQELQKISPEDFSSRLEENLKRKSKPKFGSPEEGHFSSVSQPKEPLSNLGKHHKTKVLNDIMKIELIQDMSADEVSKLWESHFKDKDGISATIPADLYKVMCERGIKYPMFVFPLPRGQGYEFFLSQVESHEIHFTSLINYQSHRENAPECLTMVHYPDLESKGIILMRGEFNKDVLNAKEAQCLANQFQLYYGKSSQARLALLERLNYNPSDFKHMDLVAELECLSLNT